MKEKYGRWFPEKIESDELQDIADWLNGWADFDKHDECLDDESSFVVDGKKKNNHITKFGRGYQKAISDVFDKLGLDFRMFDKRTKTGFKK